MSRCDLLVLEEPDCDYLPGRSGGQTAFPQRTMGRSKSVNQYSPSVVEE